MKPLALAASEGGTYYTPTRESLIARTYPLTRPIFACANQPPGQPFDPKVRDFLRFILGPKGQRVLSQGDGYLPLGADAAQRELAKLP